MQPGSNFNPYAPRTADIDQALQLVSGEHELASRGTRLGAFLVDWMLLGAVALPGGFLAGFLVATRTRTMSFASTEMLVLGVTAVIGSMMLAFQIYQWYLVATTGQSLAKRWLGLQIVRIDGSPLGFVHGVVLRSWVMAALGYVPFGGPFIYFVVDPLLIAGEGRRCLHDHIAGTRVIVAA